jgi:hypothetical protein
MRESNRKMLKTTSKLKKEQPSTDSGTPRGAMISDPLILHILTDFYNPPCSTLTIIRPTVTGNTVATYKTMREEPVNNLHFKTPGFVEGPMT